MPGTVPQIPKPLHFHLQASDLTRAAACVNNALQARNPRVPDSEFISSVREKRRKKKKPAKNLELTRASGQPKPIASPLPPVAEATKVEEGAQTVHLEEVSSKNRVVIKSPVNLDVGLSLTSREEAGK